MRGVSQKISLASARRYPAPTLEGASCVSTIGPRRFEESSQILRGGTSVLLVGDDHEVIDPLTHMLRREGLRAVGSYDADSALRLADAENPSAVLLCIDFKMRTGRSLLQTFARRGHAGLIVLGSSPDEGDAVLAFDLGAQDYLSRPFAFRELLARINASVRRSTMQQSAARSANPRAADILRAGQLVLDGTSRLASFASLPLQLTPTEFRILELLLIHSGKLVESQVLLRRVWGRYRADEGNTVRTSICRLRRKLREAGAGEVLETRRRAGFVLRAERTNV
jgi:DNA-binding response OmpR family regulator